MKDVFVIAGNLDEYADWINNKPMLTARYCYVKDYPVLRGLLLLDPDGIFIGTWYTHPDIYHILQELTLACEDPKKQAIIQSVRKKYTDYLAGNIK